MLPVGAVGDNCYACGSSTVGGVSLFLECAVEVRVGGVPSAVYIDCVAGGQGASKIELLLTGS